MKIYVEGVLDAGVKCNYDTMVIIDSLFNRRKYVFQKYI